MLIHKIVKTYLANTVDSFADNFFIITMDEFSNKTYRIIVAKNGTMEDIRYHKNSKEAISDYHSIQEKLIGTIITKIESVKNE